MSHRQDQNSGVGEAGIWPRYITGDEALAQVQTTRRYADAVDKQIKSSALPPDRREAWAAWYGELYRWVNNVINRGRISIELGAATIADQAEKKNNEAAAFSREAQASGAAATVPPQPTVPGTWNPPSFPNVLPTLQLGSLAIIALAVLYLAPKRR